MKSLIALMAGAGAVLAATPVRADPCTAISRPCRRAGEHFIRAHPQGTRERRGRWRLHVRRQRPECGRRLSEMRLSDFSTPELSTPEGQAVHTALQGIAAGRTAIYAAGLGTCDPIAARCSIDGLALGELVGAAGVSEGENGSRGGRLQATGSPRQLKGTSAGPAPRTDLWAIAFSRRRTTGRAWTPA